MITPEKWQKIQDNVQATRDAYDSVNDLLNFLNTIIPLANPDDPNNKDMTDEILDTICLTKLATMQVAIDTTQAALKVRMPIPIKP